MPRHHSKQDNRSEVLVTLQHGLERTLLLATRLIDDPVVGSEARGLHSQLAAIQAEVDLIAAERGWLHPLSIDRDGIPSIWQSRRPPLTAPERKKWMERPTRSWQRSRD